MRFSHSLRFRVATAFAAFGGLVSLLIAIGLYFSAQDTGQRLIDETLNAEVQDFLARRLRNPQSLPPATATLVGYATGPHEVGPMPPDRVARLPAGRHTLTLDGHPYRVAVIGQSGVRYYLLYNETLLRERQARLLLYLAIAVLLMTLLSGAFALWAAERVIEPVKELARRVRSIGLDGALPALAADFPPDEVGGLARSFEETLQRLAGFIARERAFTADVSHELRTPLAVIRGAAEVLLAQDDLSPAMRERLGRIERAAADMAELASALLAMAREKDDATRDPIDIAALVEDTVEKQRPLLRDRPIEVVLEIVEHPKIQADPSLLATVVANLVRNSFTHTDRGQVHIRVDAHSVTITDSGLGIPQEALDKVFQRHFKGQASPGEGIGLSLVKKICDRYGWRIELASETGRGTRAVLRFKQA